VAEAAKVIENTQRDVNIALINELALMFDRLGIDTEEVLLAAGTKWNFLPFRPGLVGGHCIGVDPYYLTHKAQEDRLSPGNDPGRSAHQRRHGRLRGATGGQADDPAPDRGDGRQHPGAGLTFKENCPDLRNTRVVDIVREFRDYHACVDVYDPWVDPQEAKHEYGIDPVAELKSGITTPSSWRWDIASFAKWGPRASAPPANPTRCCSMSNTCCRPAASTAVL
jgi:UDP-N-acetyl-D-galactosamine dehydrogenase